MGIKKPNYNIKEKVWLYSEMPSWHFVNVSKPVSKEIKKLFGNGGRGFGSVPVLVTVGKTNWKTSIFPDKKKGVYILPIKAEVRKKEGIVHGKMLNYSIKINI